MEKEELTTKEKTKGCAASIVLLIVFYFLVSRSCNSDNAIENKPKREELINKSMAYFCSQACVKKELVAPATANFPFFYEETNEIKIKKINDSTFSVHSFVDSENKFGAKLRVNYSCEVRFTNNGENFICENTHIYE